MAAVRPVPHLLLDLDTQRALNEYEYARTTPLNITSEPYYEHFKALGTAILADFARHGYALVQLPPEQDEWVRQETARIDAMQLHLRPEQESDGKVAVTMPAPACDEHFARVVKSPQARARLLSTPEVQEAAAARENVERIDPLTVRLADALHASAVFITGAVCSAHTGERFHRKEERLLAPSPHDSAVSGGSVMRINVYGAVPSSAPASIPAPLVAQTAAVPYAAVASQAHIDLGLVTLVASHIADAGGRLEIRRGVTWVALPKDHVVVLPGRALVGYLGGSGSTLEAAEHRVCAPTVAGGRRISVAFHLRPNPAAPSMRRSDRQEFPGEQIPDFGSVLQNWRARMRSVNESSSGVLDPVLDVAVRIADEMSYTIRVIGRRFGRSSSIVKVNLDATVEDLKRAYAEKEGIAMHALLHLSFGETHLMKNRALLRTYNIPQTAVEADAPTVEAYLLLRGD